MSRRLLRTSTGLPGFVSRMISHLVHPSGAACRTIATASRHAAGVAARSSSYAASRTSAATARSTSRYLFRVASPARATHMPLKPPSPTPCVSRNRRMPASSASSLRCRPITLSSCCANAVDSAAVSAAIAAVSAHAVRHCVHSSAAFAAAARAALASSASARCSHSSRMSKTALGVHSGSPHPSMRLTISSAAAGLAPWSWCIAWDSSWITCSTSLLPRTGSCSPVRRIATIPGLPSLGLVCFPASDAFALPTARKNSYCPAPPASRMAARSAISRVRHLSSSPAPSATVPSYSPRARKYRRRHSSRSAIRRPSPASLPSTAALNSASSVGALPNTPAQSAVWNILWASV